MNDFIFCSVESGLGKTSIEFKENIEGIDEWPYNWPDGEVSYRLNNFSEDLSHKWQIRAVTVSLRAWQLRINKLRFRRERNPDVHVDLNVNFAEQGSFSSEGVLAHAWFPGQGDISGDVEINDKWNWVPGVYLSDIGHPPMVPILIHEFGHSVIGLRHDTATSSQNTEIMYPSFNLGRKFNQLGPRTITRAQERYGARTLSQRILDYFLARRLRGGDFR